MHVRVRRGVGVKEDMFHFGRDEPPTKKTLISTRCIAEQPCVCR